MPDYVGGPKALETDLKRLEECRAELGNPPPPGTLITALAYERAITSLKYLEKQYANSART